MLFEQRSTGSFQKQHKNFRQQMRFSTVQVLIPIKWWLRQLLFGLHLFSLKCCAYFLPGSYGNEHRYPNPETVCTNEICPEVEWADPEVEAIQVCSDEVNQASVELTQTDGELENMAAGLPGCNGVAASTKKNLVRLERIQIGSGCKWGESKTKLLCVYTYIGGWNYQA